MSYMGPVGSGGSGALYFEVQVEQGIPVSVVLKPIPNGQGPKLPVNELVCGELAFRLGLPCKEPFIVEIPQHIAQNVLLPNGGGQLPSGLGFAISTIQGQSPPTSRHVSEVDNCNHLVGIIAFDAWVANIDRQNAGNLMGGPSPDQTGKYRVWMIDHGHCITGPTWTADALSTSGPVGVMPYLDVLEPGVQRARDSFAAWTTSIESIADAQIDEVIGYVPDQWLPDISERDALKAFLCRRRHEMWPTMAARFGLTERVA